MVRVTGVEPAHRKTLDPKSSASANSAIPAKKSGLAELSPHIPAKKSELAELDRTRPRYLNILT